LKCRLQVAIEEEKMKKKIEKQWSSHKGKLEGKKGGGS